MRCSMIFVSFAIILAACAPAPTPTPNPTLTPLPTATPNLDATATAQVQATARAQVQATAAQATATSLAFQSQQSATAQAFAAQATATMQAAFDVLNPLMQGAKKAFGPAEGVLEQKTSGTIASSSSGMFLRNFVVEVRFFNPADAKINPWNYGLLFRRTGTNIGYRLSIDSLGIWRLYLESGIVSGRVAFTFEGSSYARNFDATSSGSNLLRVVINEKLGYFFVNDDFVGTLDISEKNVQGDILIAATLDPRHDYPGLPIRFKDFSVSSLP